MLSQEYSETLSGFDTNTPAQELLAVQERAALTREMTDGVRSFARSKLLNDTKFQDKLCLYLRKTHGNSTFFDNRLQFDANDGIWMLMNTS